MELTVKIHKTTYIKKTICLMLCISVMALTFIIDYKECQAIVPAIVLGGLVIPEAVAIVGALLVATGLKFATDAAIEAASDAFYTHCAPAIKQGVTDMVEAATDGIASVPTDVWNAARDWTQSNFVEGDNAVSYNYHRTTLEGQYVPFSVNAGEADTIYPIKSLVWEGQTYTLVVDTSRSTCDELRVYVDGENGGFGVMEMKKGTTAYMYLDTPTSQNSSIGIKVRYTDRFDNICKWNVHTLSGTSNLDGVQEAKAQPFNISASVTGETVLGNPGWDIELDGTREVGFPLDWTDLAGKTYEDVSNPDTTGDDPMVPPIDPTWLQGLLEGLFGGIQGVIDNIWQWLQNFWNNLLQKLGEALQPLTDILSNILAKILDLVNSVAAVQSNTLQPDMNSNFNSFSLPDLFLLLLLLILAVIRLLLRALTYIVTLYGLDPSSDMFHEQMVEGINFLKNQQIPYFDMQFYSIYEIVIGLLFGLSVIRLAKKFVLSLNDGGFLSYIRNRRNGG